MTDNEEKKIRECIRIACESWLVKTISPRFGLDKFDEGALDSINQTNRKRLLQCFLEERKTLAEVLCGLKGKFKERIKGQDELVHSLLIALILSEHCLLEGLPGVGKTEIVKWVAHVTGLPFSRVQFIPDMLPSDLIGKDHINIIKLRTSKDAASAVEWVNGPIFSSIILADEINRAPSKVQAALLESMGERQVTPFGKMSMPVFSPLHQAALELWPEKFPFLFGEQEEISGLFGMPVIPSHRKDLMQFTVFATMNPIEQEGTYPLSEAQTDRFCFKVIVPYPPRGSYLDIMNVVYSGDPPPDALEINLPLQKCKDYFEKYPAQMIPVLMPVYFLLKCRAHIFPVKIGKDEWRQSSSNGDSQHLVVDKPLFFSLASASTEGDVLQKLHDIVYMTNARTSGLGEIQGTRQWYDREQIEMRRFIGQENLDNGRRERFTKILEEEHCQYVKAGGSPRGFLKLVSAALCQALLEGRKELKEQDIMMVIDNVLRHRIHMDVHARMAGVSSEDVIRKVCEIILVGKKG